MVPIPNNTNEVLERFFSPEEIAFLMRDEQFNSACALAKSPDSVDRLLLSGFDLLRRSRVSPG
jgi:hypothetical protein